MTSPAAVRDHRRAKILGDLRRILPKLEGFQQDSKQFSFGVPDIDAHLPQGLAYGVLHEIAPETDADFPVAFGFAAALLGRMADAGPAFLIMAPKLADFGRPYGHGLNRLGLSPERLILVDASTDVLALWAIEEALRSGACAALAGVIGTGLDLKMSRRLHLAAGLARIPLLLVRPADAAGASAAATRWRVGSAAAGRDRFGLLARRRWRLRLERCRNGRTGGWLVEFDHVAYRFSLASPLADPALSRGADAQSFIRGASRS